MKFLVIALVLMMLGCKQPAPSRPPKKISTSQPPPTTQPEREIIEINISSPNDVKVKRNDAIAVGDVLVINGDEEQVLKLELALVDSSITGLTAEVKHLGTLAESTRLPEPVPVITIPPLESPRPRFRDPTLNLKSDDDAITAWRNEQLDIEVENKAQIAQQYNDRMRLSAENERLRWDIEQARIELGGEIRELKQRRQALLNQVASLPVRSSVPGVVRRVEVGRGVVKISIAAD
ncbi:MAG: hypothetical protein AAGG51_03970 [Cyanobacteria bacterium P01_G01_bin.54]